MRIHMRLFNAFLPLLLVWGGSVAFAQNATLTGKVLDENGEGLVGATVLVDGTGKGIYSDADGNYEISGLPAGEQVVIVRYIGYDELREVVALTDGETTRFKASLSLEGKVMDDVIIVGYGVERKRDMTGSVSKIGAKEINEIPASSIDAALQGKAAGVQVIQGSGAAGSGALIRVRGVGSISAGGDPLYVVDGIPITQDPFINGDRGGQNNNPLSSINPQDIESIEILKDAAAAAIYGSRGANGVVLITTKRGRRGKPQVDFSARVGGSRPTRLPEFLNTEEWIQLYQEAWENDGNVGQPAILPGGYTIDSALAQGTTDWYDATTRVGVKQEYSVSLRQGGKKFQTFASVSAMDNQSYIIGNAYRRYTGRLNLDYNVLDNLKVTASTSLAYGQNNRASQAWAGSIGTAMSTALPYYGLEDPNTNFGGPGNPVTQNQFVDWRSVETRSINTAQIQYQPVKNLTINANGSFDYMDLNDSFLEDSVWTNFLTIGKNWETQVRNWNTNAFARYDFSMLPERHELSFMAGGEAQRAETNSMYMEVTDVSDHLYLDWEGSDRSDTVNTTNPRDAYSFISTFGRVNYVLDNKYVAKASVRVDGSSKFGRNNRYGVFPALGAGWIISEENFWSERMKTAVNYFKLKASFGMTGNADIGSFQRFGTISGRNNNLLYNNDSIIIPIRLENPNLAWETTTTVDAGFEVGFLNDRITAEFAVYNKESRDVLLDTRVQTSKGFATFLQNVGQVPNRGIELGITSYNLTGKLKWRTTLNIAHNRNKVIDVGTTPPDALAGSGDTRVVEGEPVGVNFLVRFSHVDPNNGRPVYLDADGNETYDWSTDHRVVVGNVQPLFQGGLRNEWEYKNFSVVMFWTFSYGGKIYDDAAKRYNGVVVDWNMRRDMINRWTGPGDTDAQYPVLTLDPATYGLDNFWNYNTTQWLYDASFARLKTFSVGYDIPFSPEKNSFIRSLRVTAMGTNLITITNYPGLDPEVVRDHNGPQGRNISPNVSYLTAPQERVLSLGVDVSF